MSAVVKFSERALSAKVDKLGALNAEIAALKKVADKLKDELKESGEAEIFGRSFKAVVSIKSSVKLDVAIAKSFLSVAEIAAASKVVDSVSISLFDL